MKKRRKYMPEEHDLGWRLITLAARWIAWVFAVPWSLFYIVSERHFDAESIAFVLLQTPIVTIALLFASAGTGDKPHEKDKREESPRLAFRRGSGDDVPP